MPIETLESAPVEKVANLVTWSGVVVATAGLVSKLMQLPEGMPIKICGTGLFMMAVGHSVKVIGNRPVDTTTPRGELSRIPAGHLGGYERIMKARELGRPLNEEELQGIADKYDSE